jgi:hypothetical protein
MIIKPQKGKMFILLTLALLINDSLTFAFEPKHYIKDNIDFDIKDNIKPGDICQANNIGTCWLTEYGIMTKDDCCYTYNSTVTQNKDLGRIENCYRFNLQKVQNQLNEYNKQIKSSQFIYQYYILADPIISTCNVYSSCEIKVDMWRINQDDNYKDDNYKDDKYKDEKNILTSMFSILFFLGIFMILIAR